MATIHGGADRGLHLLPALDAGQATLLGATALAVWGLWGLHAPLAPRVAAGAATAALGLALALARWPRGAAGERLPIWIGRVARYSGQPRLWLGPRVAAWLGLQGLAAGSLYRAARSWRVLLCEGRDHAACGPEGLESAQAAYVEFLQAMEGPVQVVSWTRWLTAADRPAGWDALAAPPALRTVAEHYGRHWSERVAGQVLRRQCATVLLLPATPGGGAGEGGAGVLAETEVAFRAFAGRVGLSVTAPEPQDLAAVLGAMLGAGAVAAGAGQVEGWRVGRAPL